MVTQIVSVSQKETEIIYPDSDGQPMADNTIQFHWITVIQYNLAWLFADNPQVFVAGDLLWYPEKNNNKLRQAPDVMVVFGIPKGERGSYKQWEENNLAPQVVFEILSPGNTVKEMNRKLLFYDRYNVEEYYLYDPQTNSLTGWIRSDSWLEIIEEINGWISPRLGITFQVTPETLILYRPDGKPFVDYVEVQQRLRGVEEELEQERQARKKAEERAFRLEQLLREAGITPEQ